MRTKKRLPRKRYSPEFKMELVRLALEQEGSIAALARQHDVNDNLLFKMKTLSRHSELAKAFGYALNQWPALTYYADDGWAEADNNIAENALRMVSLGRKNFLFLPVPS
ncbi:transposase [Escherichia coli]|nr:transposase [Escherichia coli]